MGCGMCGKCGDSVEKFHKKVWIFPWEYPHLLFHATLDYATEEVSSFCYESVQPIPYFFILLYKVLRSMARSRAALLLLPSAALSAFSILWRSVSSSWSVMGSEG